MLGKSETDGENDVNVFNEGCLLKLGEGCDPGGLLFMNVKNSER